MDVSLGRSIASGAVPTVPSLSGVSRAASSSPEVLVAVAESTGATATADRLCRLAGLEAASLVPRELAVEACPCSTSFFFKIKEAHPMVHPEEKEFILGCLQAFAQIVEHEGGFAQYAYGGNCPIREELAGKLEDDEPSQSAEEVLRRSAETLMRQTVRNGGDSVSVQIGGTFCMGMKKVTKVELKCEDLQMELSIFWDWDVKLEQVSHADN